MGFVANFIRFPAVQKFWKLVKIWQSYRQLKGGNFFRDTVYVVHTKCYIPSQFCIASLNKHARRLNQTINRLTETLSKTSLYQTASTKTSKSTIVNIFWQLPTTPPQPFYGPFSGHHPGEPVPEENFWTLWCKGILTETDILTIRLGATPSGLTTNQCLPPPSPHIFYRPDALPAANWQLSTAQQNAIWCHETQTTMTSVQQLNKVKLLITTAWYSRENTKMNTIR